jgi:hypothetical protein
VSGRLSVVEQEAVVGVLAHSGGLTSSSTMRRTRSYSGHMSVQMPMSLTESLRRIWPSGFMRPSRIKRSRSLGRIALIYAC